MKLLGTGVRGIPWKSIEVTRKRGAPPEIVIHGKAINERKNGYYQNCTKSITFKKYAIASAIGEAKDNYWQPSA